MTPPDPPKGTSGSALGDPTPGSGTTRQLEAGGHRAQLDPDVGDAINSVSAAASGGPLGWGF